MCLNGGEAQEGKKSCGQAGYVIYNSSPESMLKFKQVETFEDFERIDNYEYRYVFLLLFRLKRCRQNKWRVPFWMTFWTRQIEAIWKWRLKINQYFLPSPDSKWSSHFQWRCTPHWRRIRVYSRHLHRQRIHQDRYPTQHCAHLRRPDTGRG